jgi:flavin reductase (DIM6/NTAB) family NADH-FMN oxidoreductase RutF
MTIRMEPAFDLRSFRRALGHFPTGVCIVASQAEDTRVGMTVSSFNSLSLEPPLVLFGIDAKASGLPLWKKAKGYAINVLAENQKDLSDRFAKSGSNKGTVYADGLFGAPVLPGVAAVLECAAWATHAGGDHVLFIAEVKRFRTSGTDGLWCSTRGGTPSFTKPSLLHRFGRSTFITEGAHLCSRPDRNMRNR